MECNFENCPNFERLGKKFADRISELERENAELKAYKDVNEDFKTAWEELKAKNFELKESLKCFQTPEAIKALTFYKTGEFELQEKKCIKLEQENAELKAENEKLKQVNKESAHYLACMTERRNKANAYLREIKTIAIRAFAKQQEYKKDFGEIIGIIANAEEE